MPERPSPDATLEIVPCTPAHYEVFRRLNYEWIDRYFGVETVDREMLDAPQAILDHGGHILVALIGGHPVGVCALVPEGEGTFELAKMAVDGDVRGRGIGWALGQGAIATARAAGASRLVLQSNTVLAPAIALYRKLGFVEVHDAPSLYARSNIHMELRLATGP
jgi:ribosomal protein S18 acetylase RimI-like enzyme